MHSVAAASWSYFPRPRPVRHEAIKAIDKVTTDRLSDFIVTMGGKARGTPSTPRQGPPGVYAALP